MKNIVLVWWAVLLFFVFSYLMLVFYIRLWRQDPTEISDSHLVFKIFHLPEESFIVSKNQTVADFQSREKPSGPNIKCSVLILTYGNYGGEKFSTLTANRLRYAQKFRYCYLHATLLNSMSKREGKYTRYSGVWRLISWHLKDPNYTWILTMDEDAAFTDFTRSVTDVIEEIKGEVSVSDDYASGPSVIVPTDVACGRPVWTSPLNSGVMIYKGGSFTLEFMRLVIFYKDSKLPNTRYLWEDQARVSYVLEEEYGLDISNIYKQCKEWMANKALPTHPPPFKSDTPQDTPPDNCRYVVQLAANREVAVVNGPHFAACVMHNVEIMYWHVGSFILHLCGMEDDTRQQAINDISAKLKTSIYSEAYMN